MAMEEKADGSVEQAREELKAKLSAAILAANIRLSRADEDDSFIAFLPHTSGGAICSMQQYLAGWPHRKLHQHLSCDFARAPPPEPWHRPVPRDSWAVPLVDSMSPEV